MKTKHALSALIAFRDSEPMDPVTREAIVNDPNTDDALSELESMRNKLNSLPDKELDEDLWENIVSRTTTQKIGRTTKGSPSNYLMAMAASVFAFAAAVVLFLQPTYMPSTTPTVEFAEVTDLQTRSQLLQRSLANYKMQASANPSGLTRASYRDSLAHVDGRINQLAENDPYNGLRAQNLWEERVDVLEDWLVMERVGRFQRTAY